LLLVDRGRKDYMHHFNRIRQKSVDFVLVDKSSMTTTLAIELDDRSHNYPDRIRRDEMVNQAFRAAGLPLLRITNQRTYDESTVQHTIEENVHGH
jgi:very-short-patch-repair endonuclease